jgi:predicted RNA-binding protein with PIN domain
VASGDIGSDADPADFDVVIVDGFNALGSRPDGWWRDRPAAMERLVGELVELARRLGPDVGIEVCFDGRPHERVVAAAAETVAVSFAGGGANAADRLIAARVRELADERRALVVSSDKRLAAAVKAAGGETVGAGAFVRSRLGPAD